MSYWKSIKNFKSQEFDSPDIPGSGEGMDEDFIRILDGIRKETGVSMPINSGFRTTSHNAKVGGVSKSAHLRKFAADIAAPTDAAKKTLIDAAIRRGVKRVGIGANFVHLDIDKNLPNTVVWFYPSTPDRLKAWKPQLLADMNRIGPISTKSAEAKLAGGKLPNYPIWIGLAAVALLAGWLLWKNKIIQL